MVQDFPTYNVGYPHSIIVNQIPFKYYNGNQSVEISKLQGLRVYMQSPKFEIPALRFPCKDPVIPCKHLQCSYSLALEHLFPLWLAWAEIECMVHVALLKQYKKPI